MNNVSKTIFKVFSDYVCEVLDTNQINLVMGKVMCLTSKTINDRFKKDNWSINEIQRAYDVVKDARLKNLIQ